MSSNFVYTGPATAEKIGNSGELNPIISRPSNIENIVTSKLNTQKRQYDQINVSIPEGDGSCSGSGPSKLVTGGNSVVDVDLEESPSEKDVPEKMLSNIEKWAKNITPDEWKKYAIYAGIALIGKKILFK